MSLEEKRCWPKEKFLKLATHLLKKGWAPALCMSPMERISWEPYLKTASSEISCPCFENLGELASYIYESGLFIGNDSGLGHLASTMGIPTLSIFARRSYSRLWRPGWGVGKVVCPPHVLMGAKLMNRYWKELLTTRQVLQSFLNFSNRPFA